MTTTRRTAIFGSLAAFLTSCGGGGDAGGGDGSGTLIGGTGLPPGSTQTTTLTALSNGVPYPVYIYVPPNSENERASLPTVYLLDGDTRFAALAAIVYSMNARVIVVGIGGDYRRTRDYIPLSCSAGGGGQAEYFDFIRFQLIPYVESSVGGNPGRRALFGHSHGGSFVFYALFAEAAASHHFSVYLPSDASIPCMPGTVYDWEFGYAASNSALPVRLYISYADNALNATFASQIQSRGYTGLTIASQSYGGGHIGMLPLAFSDSIRFAYPA
jgi:hypothetical protein